VIVFQDEPDPIFLPIVHEAQGTVTEAMKMMKT
jgi:hypothetical protein